jgi:acylglycerol lipase
MLARAADLHAGSEALADGKGNGQQYRVWVGHGSKDRVTSHEASKRFVERLRVTDKQFKSYDGWFHKLHAEPGEDKITFANDVADWILARSGWDPQRSEDAPAKSRL